MTTCIVCARAIDGASIGDPESGVELHAACLAERLPQDAFLAAIAALALVLAPAIVVWAG